MYHHVRSTYCWPQMAANIYRTVRTCNACAKSRVRLRKRTHPLRLFPAQRPLESLSIDILGPLTKKKKGHRFLLDIKDRFTKLTQVIPLRRIDAYTVALAFVEACICKYGRPKTLISDNSKQFAAKFFQGVCSLLGLSNIFTSIYHTQTNGQFERYNRTILAMLRDYINEHQDDWDKYATSLTYAYSNQFHRSTGTTPFSLIFSSPPPEFSWHHSIRSRPWPTQEQRNDYVKPLDDAIQHAFTRPLATQARYKRYFDKRIRTIRQRIKRGDYVYVDPADGQSKTGKLRSSAIGPFRVLRKDDRTYVIDHDGASERINADRVTYSLPLENSTAPHKEATGRHEKNKEGPTYVVDEILDHRKDTHGSFEFHVKRYGYKKTTWETHCNIPEELVSRYFKKQAWTPRALTVVVDC